MEPTDEQLMHAFYACDNAALERLSDRVSPLLARVAYITLLGRTGSSAQSGLDWDINERLTTVWHQVVRSKSAGFGYWPHQRISVFTWLAHLVTIEVDRHLGMRPPF